MSAAATRPVYSLEEYVRLEEYANLKHEFLDGQVWAMAGGTPEHARMASAINAAFVSQLREKRCGVYSSDARVRVIATGLDTYPDVTVVCGHEERDEGDRLAITNPIVVVEVTSDGSESYDRGEKLEHYKRIDSLREIVLVSHRDPTVGVLRREVDGTWSQERVARIGQHVRLESIGCDIVVADVYRDPYAQ